VEELVRKDTVQDASYQDGSFVAEFGYLENQRTGVSDGKLLALKPYALVMLGEAYHETLTKQCDEQSAEGRTHLVETMNKLTGRTNGGHDG